MHDRPPTGCQAGGSGGDGGVGWKKHRPIIPAIPSHPVAASALSRRYCAVVSSLLRDHRPVLCLYLASIRDLAASRFR